jgi:hypothetical protein
VRKPKSCICARSSMVEHLPFKQRVAGSSPAEHTTRRHERERQLVVSMVPEPDTALVKTRNLSIPR